MQRAIDEYLARELRDLWYFKDQPISEMRRLLDEISGHYPFVTQPYDHQVVTLYICLRWGRIIPLLDMGLGKTKMMLDVCAVQKHLGNPRPMLVLVPSTTNAGSWVNDAQIHAPHLHVQALVGSKNDRLEILDTPADVTVMTYAACLHYCCKKRESKKKKRVVMYPHPTLLRHMAKRYQFFVMDEITKMCSDSLSTMGRMLTGLSKHMERVYGLTGTPFGNDPLAIFGQFKAVDLGETFGDVMGVYREAFFRGEDQFFGGTKYFIRKKRKKLLHQWIRNRSIRYEESECLDMPKRIYEKTYVLMPQSTWNHYEKIRAAINAARQNKQILNNKYIEARYLAAGFMSIKAEGGTEVNVKMGENPKLEALLDWINRIPDGRQAIVFNYYNRTGDLLEEAFKKEHIRHLRLYSGTTKKETLEARFKADPTIKVLLSSSAGAYGLNLQNANYVGFYESPSDPKERKQMEARAYRTGQTRTVFINDFAVKASPDTKILKALAEGKDLFAELVEGRVTL